MLPCQHKSHELSEGRIRGRIRRSSGVGLPLSALEYFLEYGHQDPLKAMQKTSEDSKDHDEQMMSLLELWDPGPAADMATWEDANLCNHFSECVSTGPWSYCWMVEVRECEVLLNLKVSAICSMPGKAPGRMCASDSAKWELCQLCRLPLCTLHVPGCGFLPMESTL
jgi:hypothetical protein